MMCLCIKTKKWHDFQNGKTIHQFPGGLSVEDAIRLFSDYLRVTGVAHTGPETHGDHRLIGKRLGLLNGSSWITLWANYFGRMYLPGVHLINAGNEAVQINLHGGSSRGITRVPPANLAAFKRYALDLVELGHVDAVLITCSTMNRSYPLIHEALQPYCVPVFQIDRPMMSRAMDYHGRILVIATHGPTVTSTQSLLREVAAETGRSIELSGALVEKAWDALTRGEIEVHNSILAKTIREWIKKESIACAILAQLSMSIFTLSYPDPENEFGIPVLTSGQCGFEAMKELLLSKS